jgi:hypothetical protein
LKSKYGHYLDIYSMRVIRVGSPSDPGYAENLKSFLVYKPNIDVYKKCKSVFSDLSPLNNEITEAFRYYHYYFPDKKLPDVYLHISGFNQSMIADSGLVSVSIDKYLGAKSDFYEWLAFPVYLRRKMTPEKIVPDLMRAMTYIDFPYNDSIDDVANNIIYQGKALWMVKKVMPELNDTLLFDYSKKELEWCQNHESEMWTTMVENKHVFNNERLMIQKYIGDAPFTYYFGQDSPGRTGTYLGYQIVDAYMSSHPETSISNLMNTVSAHTIVAQSGYRP